MDNTAKKRVLETWEKPLSMPRPVPKPSQKKKGRKSKEQPQDAE